MDYTCLATNIKFIQLNGTKSVIDVNEAFIILNLILVWSIFSGIPNNNDNHARFNTISWPMMADGFRPDDYLHSDTFKIQFLKHINNAASHFQFYIYDLCIYLFFSQHLAFLLFTLIVFDSNK